jgi:uncharacterized protein involved in type VI secretion and phage assembly
MTILGHAEETSQDHSPQFTIALAEVVNNIDLTGSGRVQIELPWLPETQPWARVVVPGAGGGRGTYVLPHEGDEVLVAFNRSDPRDCYVVGSLWSISEPPPFRSPLDPTTKMAVRSEQGHEIQLDDIAQTITVETSLGHKLELSPSGIKLSTAGDTASITLGQAGDVKVEATTTLTIRAPKVTVEGTAQVNVESGGDLSVKGAATCRVQASTIFLN